MNKITLIIIILILIATGGFLWYKTSLKEGPAEETKPSLPEKQPPAPEEPLKEVMEVKSPAFENNGSIPKKYTCDGEDVSPPLLISNVPPEAETLVLFVDDPDAPGGTFLHWMVWNIPAETKEIKENSVPEGAAQGINDFGKKGYGGPCPPSGQHRYVFTLYAIDKKLELPGDISRDELRKIMSGTVLQKTDLIGVYSR